jgi:hypothetical protein
MKTDCAIFSDGSYAKRFHCLKRDIEWVYVV